MVTYKEISEQEWDAYPPSTSPKPSTEWDALLDQLDQGKVLSIPYTDSRDRRSKRIAIARRASRRGFKTEVRYSETEIAIRKVDATPTKTRQTRKRRTTAEY